jgi:hypothetical protein
MIHRRGARNLPHGLKGTPIKKNWLKIRVPFNPWEVFSNEVGSAKISLCLRDVI